MRLTRIRMVMRMIITSIRGMMRMRRNCMSAAWRGSVLLDYITTMLVA